MERLLDIIVTHYQEPVDVYVNFFTMLNIQRMIDPSQVNIILVQDGPLEENMPAEYTKMSWEESLKYIFYDSNYPYQVEALPENRGVSAARNLGLKKAAAKWVMFCDCDDMFANPYSLMNILNVLDTDQYDILNCKFYAEKPRWISPFKVDSESKPILQLDHPQSIYIHGKLYRREFLLENDLWFPEYMRFSEDTVFNVKVNLRVKEGRGGDIKAEAPLYVWTYRKDSLSASDDSYVKDLVTSVDKAMELLPDFKALSTDEDYLRKVAVVFYDAFYHPCRDDSFDPLFRRVYDAYIDDFRRVSIGTRRRVEREIRKTFGARAQEYLEKTETNYGSIDDWLKRFEKEESV